VLGALLIAALVSLTVAGVWLGAALVARHRAQAAADLAALAAAQRVVAGPGSACRAAADVAAAMRARVEGCVSERLDVVVTVAVPVGVPIAAPAVATARAGPPLGRWLPGHDTWSEGARSHSHASSALWK
jgi:secretion/DNA translocation related TadE-like protein